jgi:hypothetical protein
MRHSLLIISLFLFYGLHAQKVSGYWYGQANVEMSGIQNNYLTELIIVQKGTKVRGFFGYYFKDVYQSFLVKGSYDPQSRQIIIRDIPIIYFNTNSTSASVECITSFYGKLLVSRVKSTLTGYFYRDKKYEYTCPDLRVNYTLYPESNVEDSVFKDIVVTKSYWKPQPNAFADNHQKKDSTVSVPTAAANGKSIPVQASLNEVSPTDSSTRTATSGKSIPVQASLNGVSPTDSLTRTTTSGKSIPVQAGLARVNPADSLTHGGPSKQVSMGAGASDMVMPVGNQDLVKISEDYKKRKSLVGKEIEVSSDSIRLSFYDDAIVDGDSISVFFNNQLILAHQELTEKAFNLYIKLDSLRETNEVSMFAENLGKYPPNTALMVVSDGENRYEVFLSSDFKGNATVRFKRKKTP